MDLEVCTAESFPIKMYLGHSSTKRRGGSGGTYYTTRGSTTTTGVRKYQRGRQYIQQKVVVAHGPCDKNSCSFLPRPGDGRPFSSRSRNHAGVFIRRVIDYFSFVKYVCKSFLTTQSGRCTVSGMYFLAVEPLLTDNVIPHIGGKPN